MTPLVDIVMPTYRHERFVAEAIESVLAQQTNFEFRLLIGDDCSPDGTQAIVKSYAEKHPKLIEAYLFTNHVGIQDKRRVAVNLLRRAKAKYVTILEGDDYWTDPYRLQKLTDFLESHPECSVSFHDAKVLAEDGSEHRLFPANQKEISTLEDMVTTSVFPIPCTALFRNELGELPDCFFGVTNADWMLFVLLAERGNLGYLNEVMATYRVHSGGVWSGLDAAPGISEHIKTYETIDAHLNFKYTRAISRKLATWRRTLTALEAQATLAQYHSAVKNGEIKQGLRLLWQLGLSAPLRVIRPRHLAAVIKNGLSGILFKRKLEP